MSNIKSLEKAESAGIRLIFLYYCSHGDRDNYTTLKHQGYKRLLADAQLVNQQNFIDSFSSMERGLNTSEFDILYYRKKKDKINGLRLEDLIQIIPDLAQIAHPQLKEEQRIRKVIHIHFQTLSDFILWNTQLGEDYRQLNNRYLTEQCFRLLMREQNKSALYILFVNFFAPSIKKLTETQELESLMTMMKQLQLVPKFIQKVTCYLIYKFIVSQESQHAFETYFAQQYKYHKANLSQLLPNFNFFQFVKFVILLSRLANRKISNQNLPNLKRLVNLLQRIQLSRGFTQISKNHKMFFAIDSKIVQEIEKCYQTSEIQIFPHVTTSPDKQNAKIRTHEEILKQKFQKMCIYGETLSKAILSKKKAIDLILKTGAYGPVYKQAVQNQQLNRIKTEIQLCIKTVGQLNFQNFLKLLVRIEEKTEIPKAELILRISCLQDPDLEPRRMVKSRYISTTNQNTKTALDILCSDSVLKYLKEVFQMHGRKVDEVYQMNLVEYSNMMSEFEVCPLVVSKSTLVEAFQQCLEELESQMNVHLEIYANIKFQQFLESIIVLTTFQQAKQPKIDKKADQIIILILETMYSSRGYRNFKRKTQQLRQIDKEDYIDFVRKRFLSSYQKFDSPVKKNERQSSKSQESNDILTPYLK